MSNQPTPRSRSAMWSYKCGILLKDFSNRSHNCNQLILIFFNFQTNICVEWTSHACNDPSFMIIKRFNVLIRFHFQLTQKTFQTPFISIEYSSPPLYNLLDFHYISIYPKTLYLCPNF